MTFKIPPSADFKGRSTQDSIYHCLGCDALRLERHPTNLPIHCKLDHQGVSWQLHEIVPRRLECLQRYRLLPIQVLTHFRMLSIVLRQPKPRKVKIFCSVIHGYIVGRGGKIPNQKKIYALVDLPTAKDIKASRQSTTSLNSTVVLLKTMRVLWSRSQN